MRFYRHYVRPPLTRKARAGVRLLVVLAMLCAVLVPSFVFFRRLTTQMALSNVNDAITYEVNDTVGRRMAEGNYAYDYFVSLGQNSDGQVTALTANMARINALSAAVLKDVVTVSDRETLDVHIPLGNLLGSSLLLGRGPEVTVRIVPLTSSHISLRNELTAAGINQTRHQILLDIVVDVSVLIPWNTAETRVECPILIAETVIVGDVPTAYYDATLPSTYYNYETAERTDGS